MAWENEDQRGLRLWITAGLNIPEVVDLKGDAGYLFNNMIAKYTLSADHYAISEAALQRLIEEGVELDDIHVRRKFYGKGKPYIYEHSIPAKVIRTELLQSHRTEATIERILRRAGRVALILRTEDKMLKDAKLSSCMPPGWTLDDDPEARYRAVGIQISRQLLRVSGAIVR
ncbi:hypothetical protein KA005_54270 [bacterium]|nr:hypothetical protein [bacterium]